MFRMDSAQLQKLAQRNRSMKEAGVALLLSSTILGLFLLLPTTLSHPSSSATVAVASSTAPDAFAQVPITARAAVVYDLSTHQILFAKNANAQLPLASLTKLLTVYTAFSTLSPSTEVTIPADVAGLSAPHAFSPGQVFTLENLARLTLTASLNDGATAIAEAVAAHKDSTVAASLAGAAAALDLSQTYAVNGSGLDESETISGGYGSALDIARLAGAVAALAPSVAQATTQSKTTATAVNGQSFTVKNTDPMVGNFPRLLLSKTGYTDLAGGNLALVFDAGIGHPVAVVVLGSTEKDRFTDGNALIAATLAHFAGIASL